MKKFVAVILAACILALPVSAFDYAELDGMSVEELEELEKTVTKKIAELKVDADVYPYERKDYIDNTEYHIGDTWEVPGLWRFTINSVTETDKRYEKSDENPAVVYFVNYTYENIGYDDASGLYFWIDNDGRIIDSDGELGYSFKYTIEGYKIYEKVPIGVRYTAIEPIGMNHNGDFKIIITQYGNKHDRHQATFTINVE